MKKDRKVERFDYSKYESKPAWTSESLLEYEFWGFHKKKGRLNIDTKRYKKACQSVGITDFLPNGLFKQRNSVYFLPEKIKRHDYKINIFRDLINELKNDWVNEYKSIFEKIRTPKEVEEDSRLNSLMFTSSEDDYDEIDIEAKMDGIRRIDKYNRIINSLYCQFIMKVTTEIDRFTLYVMTETGYKGTDFNIDSFFKFSDGLLKERGGIKIKDLSKYNAYNMLHKINNFLKHNSIESYRTLKKLYPANVASIERGTSQTEYKNGMFAGDWLIIKVGYIDDLLDKLIIFFENYCKVFLSEDLEESKWNYDDYFMNAYYEMRYPLKYIGIDF